MLKKIIVLTAFFFLGYFPFFVIFGLAAYFYHSGNVTVVIKNIPNECANSIVFLSADNDTRIGEHIRVFLPHFTKKKTLEKDDSLTIEFNVSHRKWEHSIIGIGCMETGEVKYALGELSGYDRFATDQVFDYMTMDTEIRAKLKIENPFWWMNKASLLFGPFTILLILFVLHARWGWSQMGQSQVKDGLEDRA